MIEKLKARGITVSLIHDQAYHTKHWLSVTGNKNVIMPIVLKYMNRNWLRDIQTKVPGLEIIANRQHYSNGRAVSGPLYSAKVGLGNSIFMYTLLSIVAGDPEIHAIYPVAVNKEIQYYCKVQQVFIFQNSLECCLNITILNSDQKDCLNALEAQKPEEAAARALLDTKAKKLSLTSYPISFFSHYEDFESGDVLEIFMAGIASWCVRKPKPITLSDAKSFNLSEKDKASLGLDVEKATDVTDTPEVISKLHQEKMHAAEETDQRPYPYCPGYEFIHGILPHEKNKDPQGDLRSNESYIQGICRKITPVTGGPGLEKCFSKQAYWIRVRLDPIHNIDLNFWVLEQHMIDGNAVQEPGKVSSTPPGCALAIPKEGDLVCAKVWIYNSFIKKCDLNSYLSKATPEQIASTKEQADESADKTDSPKQAIKRFR